jgi:hypothetical protein
MSHYDIAYAGTANDQWRLLYVLEPVPPGEQVILQRRTGADIRRWDGWHDVVVLAVPGSTPSIHSFGVKRADDGKVRVDDARAKDQLEAAISARMPPIVDGQALPPPSCRSGGARDDRGSRRHDQR